MKSRIVGFSLIEMMVVLSVVALLAIVAVPLAEVTARRSKEEELKVALRQIRKAIDDYKEAVDQGRINVGSNISGYPESLDMLVTGVEDQRSPTRAKIYFLRSLPRDPFADSQLIPADTWAPRTYESSAIAPRAGNDVYDIRSRSTQQGLNGRPYSSW
jgi:general secretion pathway protein G